MCHLLVLKSCKLEALQGLLFLVLLKFQVDLAQTSFYFLPYKLRNILWIFWQLKLFSVWETVFENLELLLFNRHRRLKLFCFFLFMCKGFFRILLEFLRTNFLFNLWFFKERSRYSFDLLNFHALWILERRLFSLIVLHTLLQIHFLRLLRFLDLQGLNQRRRRELLVSMMDL